MGNDFPNQDKITKLIKDDFADNFVEKLEDSRKMHKAIMDIVNEGIKKKVLITGVFLLITLGSFGLFVGKVYIEKIIEINLEENKKNKSNTHK